MVAVIGNGDDFRRRNLVEHIFYGRVRFNFDTERSKLFFERSLRTSIEPFKSMGNTQTWLGSADMHLLRNL